MTSDYDHTHTVSGAYIPLNQTQDAGGDHCASCGRSVYAGHVDALQNTQPHHHVRTCPSYAPEPTSIAAQAGE